MVNDIRRKERTPVTTNEMAFLPLVLLALLAAGPNAALDAQQVPDRTTQARILFPDLVGKHVGCDPDAPWPAGETAVTTSFPAAPATFDWEGGKSPLKNQPLRAPQKTLLVGRSYDGPFGFRYLVQERRSLAAQVVAYRVIVTKSSGYPTVGTVLCIGPQDGVGGWTESAEQEGGAR